MGRSVSPVVLVPLPRARHARTRTHSRAHLGEEGLLQVEPKTLVSLPSAKPPRGAAGQLQGAPSLDLETPL